MIIDFAIYDPEGEEDKPRHKEKTSVGSGKPRHGAYYDGKCYRTRKISDLPCLPAPEAVQVVASGWVLESPCLTLVSVEASRLLLHCAIEFGRQP
jgi:hypothetical protein